MSRPYDPETTGRKCQQVYDFAGEWIARNGNFPTYRTIASELGISSTSVTSYYIRILLRQGRLERDADGKFRLSGVAWQPVKYPERTNP